MKLSYPQLKKQNKAIQYTTMQQQQNLQQISNLLDKKFNLLDKKFKKNNKEILKKIDGLALITKKEFDKMDEKFDKAERELAKRPTKKEIFDWADKRIVDVELDMDKVKYIHRNEWKKLPRAYEIKKTLVENNIFKYLWT